jgi:hypothetical protein
MNRGMHITVLETKSGKDQSSFLERKKKVFSSHGMQQLQVRDGRAHL